MPKKHNIIEISGHVYHTTPDAYLFSDGAIDPSDPTQKAVKKVWLPKSQCEWDDRDKVMQITEWLALEKGLI